MYSERFAEVDVGAWNHKCLIHPKEVRKLPEGGDAWLDS